MTPCVRTGLIHFDVVWEWCLLLSLRKTHVIKPEGPTCALLVGLLLTYLVDGAWRFILPDYIVDLSNRCVWKLKLNLKAIADKYVLCHWLRFVVLLASMLTFLAQHFFRGATRRLSSSSKVL